MDFFRNMDLYKGIVLASLLLLPAGGFWIHHLQKEIDDCKAAEHAATRKGGLIEQIAGMQNKIRLVATNQLKASDSIKEPRTYFDGQILLSGKGLSPTDYAIEGPRQEGSGLKGKSQADDFVMKIVWDKDLKVTRDFIYAVVFNSESGARREVPDADAPPSVWRLRDLKIENVDCDRSLRKAPPPEFRDLWRITDMEFARREPRRGK